MFIGRKEGLAFFAISAGWKLGIGGLRDTKMKMRMAFAFAVVAVLLDGYANFAPAVAAETGGSASVDAGTVPGTAVQNFSEAQISPDGERIAWVETVTNSQGVPTGASRIVLTSVKAPASVRTITAQAGKAGDESSVAWSPDSKKIAFLSDAQQKGQLQLYVADLAAGAGAAKQITHLKGLLAHPRWAPNGQEIAFLFTENALRNAGPLVAETRDEGVVGEKDYEQRLAIIDAAGGNVRQLTPADMYVYEYDWAPDSKQLTATAAHGNGDDNWYVAELYTIDAQSGKTESILKPNVQIATPRWSPDGKTIGFIGGIMSDEDSVGGDIYTISASGGQARNITPGMRASANVLFWEASSDKILFTEFVGGSSGLAVADVSGGAVEQQWKGDESLASFGAGSSVSVAKDGKTMGVIRQSFEHPPEVWAGPAGNWKQITSRNSALKPTWGTAKSLEWKSDQFDVQGWLVYPRDFDANKKYPMIVSVHGGPAAAVNPRWPSAFDYSMALSGAGYFVLYPNPRGSFGMGEDFTKANVKDFGYGDFRDIMAGVDEALKSAPIDPNRLGITGWSYGGYMTMWAVTQTQRFHAAMSGAGLANWQSYYGENKIDQWMIPYFGASVYDDPAVYAKSAPITFIKNVKTPTLIVVGDSDGECPPPQSYEFWHALETLGVENQFVIYQDEGHMIMQPKHRQDIVDRTVAWFNTHLK
jgi:dipeptidyl aminopeptidase/acylaminoacyl peptidase